MTRATEGNEPWHSMQPMIEVEGQIIHRRALSKRLVFLDIKRTLDPGDPPGTCPYLELVVKKGVFGDETAVQGVRDMYGLGDMVRVSGALDFQGSLLLKSITCIRRWSQQPVGTVGGPQFQPDDASVAWWATTVQARKNAAAHTAAREGTVVAGTETATPASAAAASTTAGRTTAGKAPFDTLPKAKASTLAIKGAAAVSSSQGVCKWWINSGRCAHGALCPLIHLKGEEAKTKRGAWIQDRMNVRKAASAQDGFFVHSAGSGAATRSLRASVLARWLVDTWGVEALSRGSGVLDVAGGRGALSWELQVVHGVRVTLVEPRPFKLDRHQHKTIKAMKKQRADAGPAVQDGSQDHNITHDVIEAEAPSVNTSETPGGASPQPAAEDGTAKVRRVQLAPGLAITQIAAWFDDRLWGPAVAYAHQPQLSNSERAGHDGGAHASGSATVTIHGSASGRGTSANGDVTVHSNAGGGCASDPAGLAAVRDSGAGNAQADHWPAEVLRLVADCSVVVGLHPDQATEQIIRFVSAMPGKPFAIVPCCVFPRLYPHRRLRAGPGASPTTTPHVPHQGSPASAPEGTTLGSGGQMVGAGLVPVLDTAASVSTSPDIAVDNVSRMNNNLSSEIHGSSQASEQESETGALQDKRVDRHGTQADSAVLQHGVTHLEAGIAPDDTDEGMWAEPRELMHAGRAAGQGQGMSQAEGFEGMPHAGGVPVTSYTELVRYLVQEGGPGTRESTLMFEGANRVVWRK